MLILDYPSKKALKACKGQTLNFQETSISGAEYPATGNGVVYGSNRPHLTGHKREFFARVTLTNNVISKVE